MELPRAPATMRIKASVRSSEMNETTTGDIERKGRGFVPWRSSRKAAAKEVGTQQPQLSAEPEEATLPLG